MPYALKSRAGFGLPIAMAAIVTIGALIAAASFASMHDYRADRNTLFQERALAAAEEGQARILRDWTTAWNTGLATGDTVDRSYAFADGSTAHVVVTRLNTYTFWVASDGSVNQTSRQLNARRRTNLLLRLATPSLRMPGAVSARDATRASGSGLVSGADLGPTGWNCPLPGAGAPAIVTDSLADVGTAGSCAGGICLSTTGGSTLGADSVLADSTQFGSGLGWDDLKAQALTGGMVLDVPATSGGTTGLTLSNIGPKYDVDGTCNKANSLNWGDPYRNAALPGACENYFPVIYLRGDLLNSTAVISGGQGQGVLIVDGNLKINGNFYWAGPIIVRGNFKTNGSSSGMGVKIVGGVLVGNLACNSTPSSPCNDITGNTAVQFSRCGLTTAVTRNAKSLQASRSWADLF
jgi:hypothetical protein